MFLSRIDRDVHVDVLRIVQGRSVEFLLFGFLAAVCKETPAEAKSGQTMSLESCCDMCSEKYPDDSCGSKAMGQRLARNLLHSSWCIVQGSGEGARRSSDIRREAGVDLSFAGMPVTQAQG